MDDGQFAHLMGCLNLPVDLTGVVADAHHAYTVGATGGVAALDLSDPTHPLPLAGLNLGTRLENPVLRGSFTRGIAPVSGMGLAGPTHVVAPGSGSYTVDIIDVSGHLVRTLLSGRQLDAGPHVLTWRGCGWEIGSARVSYHW